MTPLLMSVPEAAHTADDRWWEDRCPFVRLGPAHPEPSRDEWAVLLGRPYPREVVYFIEGPSGFIKIGISADPWRRLVEMGGGTFTMLALEAGGLPREQVLHERFAGLLLMNTAGPARWPEYWCHGYEWFLPAAPLRDYLDPKPA